MPSDPAGVRPRGTLAKHPADWYSDNCYTANFHQGKPAGGFYFLAVSLWNQDPQGRVAVVYGVSTNVDFGEGMGLFFTNAPFGALVGPALPIRPDYPTPNVFTYQNTVLAGAAKPNPFLALLGQEYQFFGTGGYDSMTFLSPFPLFKVPVGYCATLTNYEDSDFLGATFWFQLSSF